VPDQLPDGLPVDAVNDPVEVVAVQQIRTGKENACFAGRKETGGGGGSGKN
jgi:hypothetical protein